MNSTQNSPFSRKIQNLSRLQQSPLLLLYLRIGRLNIKICGSIIENKN